MMSHRTVRQLLYEYVGGELEEKVAKEVERHLAGCALCSADYVLLKEGLRLVSPLQKNPSDERPEEFWSTFAFNVERRIQDQPKGKSIFQPLLDHLAELWLYRRPQVISLAAACAVVVLATLIWLVQPLGTDSRSDVTASNHEGSVMLAKEEMTDYLRKSKILLVGITNMSIPSNDQIDLSVERRTARSLIQKARFLSGQTADEQAEELINELERILIELANMEERVDLNDVELLRTGIRQENLLFKVRMAEERYNRRSRVANNINF